MKYEFFPKNFSVFICMNSTPIRNIINEELRKVNGDPNNFKQWFGNSKVVDRNGQPLRVYHGTQADFQEFKSETGLMYFSQTTKYASQFATNRELKRTVNDSQPSVMPVYLSIQKPLDLREFKTEIISRYEFAGKLDDLGIEINSDNLKDYPMGINMGEDVRVWQWIRFNAGYLLPIIIGKGFDGIFMYEHAETGGKTISDVAYVIFEPTQVKSATGNNGEYSQSNPDITKENKEINTDNINDNFKQWFGNSKVINADGTPKKMYHGTRGEFNAFRTSLIFLTDSPNIAVHFAKDADTRKGGMNIMPLYVKAENIFDYKNNAHIDLLVNEIKKQNPNMSREYLFALKTGDWSAIESQKIRIKDLGFDSFYVKEFISGAGFRSLAVFNANQVKSATGNSGEYGNTDDILNEIETTLENYINENKKISLNEERETFFKVFHGTSAEGARDIIANGIDIRKSYGGYFGTGFYCALDYNLAKSNYADFAENETDSDNIEHGVILEFNVKSTANILDLRDSDDWSQWLPYAKYTYKPDLYKTLINVGIDGLYDNSFEGVVFYNPNALEFIKSYPL